MTITRYITIILGLSMGFNVLGIIEITRGMKKDNLKMQREGHLYLIIGSTCFVTALLMTIMFL